MGKRKLLTRKIKVKCYTLYEKITSSVIKQYSLLKFGHVPTLNKISREMTYFISKNILTSKKENFAIYATNKYPVDNSCKKNSFLLAENVARFLKLPLLVGEYRYTYSNNKFYDKNTSNRNRLVNINLPFLKNKKEIKRKKYHIIMIDDSIITGVSLKVSLKELYQITNTVTFLSVIKLKPKKYLELDFNNFILKKNSYNILSKIVGGRGYRFTSHMLRTINDLSSKKLNNFVDKIGAPQKKQLIRGFKIYFGHSLKIDK